MKKTIIMLVLGFTCASLYAYTGPIQSPQKVIAFSGLKLRAEPNMQGKVIKVIPFAQQVEILDTITTVQSVEWLEGNWVMVQYEGRKGYVFDAFLTDLPIPINDYELSQEDADISYPLLAWAENNYRIVSKNDTVQNNNHYKIIQFFEDEIVASRKESDYVFEVNVDIPNIRLGDAYNLCRSLLLTKNERELFEENTLFIANTDGIVDRVKVDIDAPVELIKTGDGVTIKVRSYQHVCGL